MRLPTVGMMAGPTLVTPSGVIESVRFDRLERLETSSSSSGSPPMLPDATMGGGGVDAAGGTYGAAGGGAYGDGLLSSSRMRVCPALVRAPIIGARGGGGAEAGRGGGGGALPVPWAM